MTELAPGWHPLFRLRLATLTVAGVALIFYISEPEYAGSTPIGWTIWLLVASATIAVLDLSVYASDRAHLANEVPQWLYRGCMIVDALLFYALTFMLWFALQMQFQYKYRGNLVRSYGIVAALLCS